MAGPTFHSELSLISLTYGIAKKGQFNVLENIAYFNTTDDVDKIDYF